MLEPVLALCFAVAALTFISPELALVAVALTFVVGLVVFGVACNLGAVQAARAGMTLMLSAAVGAVVLTAGVLLQVWTPGLGR